MKLDKIVTGDRVKIIKHQQDAIELFPNDVNVDIEVYKGAYRLRCVIDGFNAPNSAVYIFLDDKLTAGI